jgi:hypothetical protein
MPRYTAVLDACVLVPIALADALLRVAEKGLYRPLWTDHILSEAQAAIEEVHPGIDASKRFAGMLAEEHLVVTVRAHARRDLAQILRIAWPEAENHHHAVIQAEAPAQRFIPRR